MSLAWSVTGGLAQSSEKSTQLALALDVPTLTSLTKGAMATCTSPGLVAAFCRMVRSWLEAFCSAAILEPLESPLAMEPELSSTSDTHNLLWPHTTVEEALTGKVLKPAIFISTVGILSVTDSVTVPVLL